MQRSLIIFAILIAAAFSGRCDTSRRIHASFWVEPAADENGTAVSLEALSAYVNGSKAETGRLLSPGDELVVLIVMDVTGDLALASRAKEAVIAWVAQLPPKVWVGLLRAQDGLRVILDPTPDREALISAIKSLPVNGRAGLLDSLPTAAALGDAMRTKAAVRTAVFLITDSDIHNYREDFTNPVINESDRRDMSRRFPDMLIRERISKLEKALSSTQTPVFLVHLNYRTDQLNEAYQMGLMRLAALLGGSSVFCRSITEISPAISRMFDTIQSHYSLEIIVPENSAPAINLTLYGGNLSLRYRNNYVN